MTKQSIDVCQLLGRITAAISTPVATPLIATPLIATHVSTHVAIPHHAPLNFKTGPVVSEVQTVQLQNLSAVDARAATKV